MATYNRAHLIKETINAIQLQSFKDWECLIIDDGSTDRTEAVLADYLKNDSRLKYHSRPKKYKKGLSGCRNYGLDIANGRFIIFFDDDDLIHPENLSYCYNLIKDSGYYFIRYDKHPFFGDFSNINFIPITNSTIQQFNSDRIEEMISGKVAFASCCVLWSRNCFETLRFNEELIYAEEWELYTRILLSGYSGLSTNAVLYYNRKHTASNTAEFMRKTPLMLESQSMAAKLIIKGLSEKNKLNSELKKFFVRLGFEMNSYTILNQILVFSNAGIWENLKYRLGFKIYPVIKPILLIKGKMLKH